MKAGPAGHTKIVYKINNMTFWLLRGDTPMPVQIKNKQNRNHVIQMDIRDTR